MLRTLLVSVIAAVSTALMEIDSAEGLKLKMLITEPAGGPGIPIIESAEIIKKSLLERISLIWAPGNPVHRLKHMQKAEKWDRLVELLGGSLLDLDVQIHQLSAQSLNNIKRKEIFGLAAMLNIYNGYLQWQLQLQESNSWKTWADLWNAERDHSIELLNSEYDAFDKYTVSYQKELLLRYYDTDSLMIERICTALTKLNDSAEKITEYGDLLATGFMDIDNLQNDLEKLGNLLNDGAKVAEIDAQKAVQSIPRYDHRKIYSLESLDYYFTKKMASKLKKHEPVVSSEVKREVNENTGATLCHKACDLVKGFLAGLAIPENWGNAFSAGFAMAAN